MVALADSSYIRAISDPNTTITDEMYQYLMNTRPDLLISDLENAEESWWDSVKHVFTSDKYTALEREQVKNIYKEALGRYNTAYQESLKQREILTDDSPTWTKMPFQVTLGDEFETLADIYGTLMEYYGPISSTNRTAYTRGAGRKNKTKEEIAKDINADEQMMTKPFLKDTRMGYSTAINCLWQFNRDDDIVHAINRSDPQEGNSNAIEDPHGWYGLGRVYSNYLEANQTICYISFGTAKFQNIVDFYRQATDNGLAKLNRLGTLGTGGILSSIFKVVNGVVEIVLWVPATLISLITTLVKKITTFPVNRFYDMRPTMHLYYMYVDEIITNWLVAAGVYNGGHVDTGDWILNEQNRKGVNKLNDMYSHVTAAPENLPISMRMTGPSIWSILTKKVVSYNQSYDKADIQKINHFEKMAEEVIKTKADVYDYSDDPKLAPWNGAALFNSDSKDVLTKTALGATQFVAFRLEKSTDASESWSNSTQPSALAQKFNSMLNTGYHTAMDLGFQGTSSSTSGESLGAKAWEYISDVLSGAKVALDLVGLGEVVNTGVFIDVPEQWSGSSFNKSQSFNFQLRAPYGDITSIYQSIIVPLAMILAGAIPRATGANSYTQPFLCRAYCKGIFAIPLGIIDSISIKRGSSEFGWTHSGLPTCVDVSISIKDLSSAMYMALHRSWLGKDGVGSNAYTDNSFSEYLMTLAGTGTYERLSTGQRLIRRAQLASHKLRNNIFDLTYWQQLAGNNALTQMAMGVVHPLTTAWSTGTH